MFQNSSSKAMTNSTDNKFNYDNKKLSELQSVSADDHPLKMTSTDFSFSNLTVSEYNNEVNQITSEINSVALDWTSLRNITTCPCSTPFDQFSKKVRKIMKLQCTYLVNLCIFFLDTLLAMWRSLLQ